MATHHPSEIQQRLTVVRDRIDDACRRAQRAADTVKLIAVSKKFSTDAIVAAQEAGQVDFGENYVSELAAKAETLDGNIAWHMIGPIQRRAVNRLPNHLALIHTLDRVALLDRFSRVWQGTWPPFLVQINIGQEPQKAGVDPDDTLSFLTTIAETYPQVRISGLMTIPPIGDTSADTQPYFVRLRELAERATDAGLLPQYPELSMGMSQDFETAIAEGATLVRVGSAIFGPRPDA